MVSIVEIDIVLTIVLVVVMKNGVRNTIGLVIND